MIEATKDSLTTGAKYFIGRNFCKECAARVRDRRDRRSCTGNETMKQQRQAREDQRLAGAGANKMNNKEQ